jgi:hypothetical protein
MLLLIFTDSIKTTLIARIKFYAIPRISSLGKPIPSGSLPSF